MIHLTHSYNLNQIHPGLIGSLARLCQQPTLLSEQGLAYQSTFTIQRLPFEVFSSTLLQLCKGHNIDSKHNNVFACPEFLTLQCIKLLHLHRRL